MIDKIRRGFKNIFINRAAFVDSVVVNFFSWLPDQEYLRLRFRCKMGYWPSFAHPSSFCEKIQWLKIYNRKPEYTQMVDKFLVKDYVSHLIGSKYIIPTLGVWDSPDQIEWDTLPDQFVLKTTHGGGSTGVVICREKQSFDKKIAVAKLVKSYNGDIYPIFREWPYKDLKKRVIAEKYMCSSNIEQNKDLSDYKFFCFNGEPKYCQVIRDRHIKETIDFYDMNWNHQEFIGLNPKVSNGSKAVSRPKRLDEMISLCKNLSQGIPFVRVDLYDIDDNVYFGELTFFPASGFGKWTPADWDKRLGELLELPINHYK